MKTREPSRDGTRERILAATIVLMRRSGYAGIGINEILAEGGAPKGSLYHFFPQGKRQIASEALQAYAGEALEAYGLALAGAGTPGAKVRRLLALPARRLVASRYRASCPAGTVCLDLDDELEPVRATVEQFFAQLTGLIATHLGLPDGKRARSFAGLLMTTIEGAYVRGRAEHSTAAFDEAADWLAELADRLARE